MYKALNPQLKIPLPQIKLGELMQTWVSQDISMITSNKALASQHVVHVFAHMYAQPFTVFIHTDLCMGVTYTHMHIHMSR